MKIFKQSTRTNFFLNCLNFDFIQFRLLFLFCMAASSLNFVLLIMSGQGSGKDSTITVNLNNLQIIINQFLLYSALSAKHPSPSPPLKIRNVLFVMCVGHIWACSSVLAVCRQFATQDGSNIEHIDSKTTVTNQKSKI